MVILPLCIESCTNFAQHLSAPTTGNSSLLHRKTSGVRRPRQRKKNISACIRTTSTAHESQARRKNVSLGSQPRLLPPLPPLLLRLSSQISISIPFQTLQQSLKTTTYRKNRVRVLSPQTSTKHSLLMLFRILKPSPLPSNLPDRTFLQLNLALRTCTSILTLSWMPTVFAVGPTWTQLWPHSSTLKRVSTDVSLIRYGFPQCLGDCLIKGFQSLLASNTCTIIIDATIGACQAWASLVDSCASIRFFLRPPDLDPAFKKRLRVFLQRCTIAFYSAATVSDSTPASFPWNTVLVLLESHTQLFSLPHMQPRRPILRVY